MLWFNISEMQKKSLVITFIELHVPSQLQAELCPKVKPNLRGTDALWV